MTTSTIIWWAIGVVAGSGVGVALIAAFFWAKRQ